MCGNSPQKAEPISNLEFNPEFNMGVPIGHATSQAIARCALRQ